jgi:hypothetical protein
MSSSSTIDFAEKGEHSSAARLDSRTHAQPAGAQDSAHAASAAASFEMEVAKRVAPAPSDADVEGVEAGVVLLTCGILAAIAGVTFLRRLGMDLESMATVLLAIGLWRVLAAGRGPLDS